MFADYIKLRILLTLKILPDKVEFLDDIIYFCLSERRKLLRNDARRKSSNKLTSK